MAERTTGCIHINWHTWLLMSCITVSKSHKLEIYSSKTSLLRQINKIFRDINYWFKLNQLVLNYNKAHYLRFNTKNSREYVLKLNYQENYVKSSSHTKFLGLIINDSLSWKVHIDVQIKYSVFCNPNDTNYNVYWNFKNGLFCIRTFNYELWNNFGGKSTIQWEDFQNSKKGDKNYHKFKNDRLM